MSWEPTPLEEQRLAKIDQLREAGIEPYPLRVARSHTSARQSPRLKPDESC